MNFIEVGDIVMPKLKSGIRRLVLWSEGENPSHIVAEVEKNEILTVIRIEKFAVKKDRVQPEWSNSACLLLSSKGEIGWVGTGWVKKIITNGP